MEGCHHEPGTSAGVRGRVNSIVNVYQLGYWLGEMRDRMEIFSLPVLVVEDGNIWWEVSTILYE